MSTIVQFLRWILGVAAVASMAGAMQGTSGAVPSTAPTPNSTRVVLIGIEDYAQGVLSGPTRDVCALYQLYVRVLKVPSSNVAVFMLPARFAKGSPCESVPVQPATPAQLGRSMGQGVSGTNFVVVHYSGHGEERDGKQLLVLDNANTAEAGSLLSLQDLLGYMRDAGRVPLDAVFFIDACRDTSLVETGAVEQSKTMDAAAVASQLKGVRDGAVFMAAESGKESYIRPHRAYGEPGNPIGYFTWVVIKALMGGAGEGHGSVSLRDLQRYVSDEVPQLMKYELTLNSSLQIPQAHFFNDRSELLRLPSRPRQGMKFLVFAEAFIIPLDDDRKQLASGSSFDIITDADLPEQSELLAIVPSQVHFPGPFRIPLPAAGLTRPVAHWAYRLRMTFLFGMLRREFILCDSAPTVPYPVAVGSPDIRIGIDKKDLLIDSQLALQRWGHNMADLMDQYDPAALPRHDRFVNIGCLPS